MGVISSKREKLRKAVVLDRKPYGSKALLERLNPAQSDQTFELPDAVVADILLEAGIPASRIAWASEVRLV